MTHLHDTPPGRSSVTLSVEGSAHLGVIVPRLTELYRWSADELRIPDVADLVCDVTLAYVGSPGSGALGGTADTAGPCRAPGATAPALSSGI